MRMTAFWLMQHTCFGYALTGFHLGISSWGGKLTDHVAIRPRRGEGRLHNYGGGSWVSLGGGGGGGGRGKLPLLR